MLRAFMSGSMARNTLYMLGSQASMTVFQALQFLLVARALGPHDLGRVASVIAFTSALLPFSGLGLGNIAMKRLARGEGKPGLYFGNGLFLASVTGAICLAVAILAGSAFLNGPGVWMLFALFGFSELLLTKYIDIAAHVFYGLERYEFAALFYNLQMFIRVLFAAFLYFGVSAPTALDWAVLHFSGGLVAAAIVVIATARRIGRPHVQREKAWSDAKQGIDFSVISAARSVYTDIDKAVLGRFASLEIGGAYTAAYRLVYMALLPVVAVIMAAQARMFRDGKAGMRGTNPFVKRLSLAGTAYCIVLGGLIYAAAPLVPWLLGHAYAGSTEILRALCFLPLPIMFQNVYSGALAGADAHRTLAGIHAAAAVTSAALNLALVPVLSWHGAVYAAYATQVVLVLALVAFSARVRRREIEAAAAVG